MKATVLLLTKDVELSRQVKAVASVVSDVTIIEMQGRDEAWAHLAQNDISLLLIDLDILETKDQPRFDRRKNIKPQTLLAIITSQPASSAHGDWAIESHAAFFLKKPIDTDKLVFALDIAKRKKR